MFRRAIGESAATTPRMNPRLEEASTGPTSRRCTGTTPCITCRPMMEVSTPAKPREAPIRSVVYRGGVNRLSLALDLEQQDAAKAGQVQRFERGAGHHGVREHLDRRVAIASPKTRE